MLVDVVCEVGWVTGKSFKSLICEEKTQKPQKEQIKIQSAFYFFVCFKNCNQTLKYCYTLHTPP